MSSTLRASLVSLLLLGPALAQERTGDVKEIKSDISDADHRKATDVVIVSEGYRKADKDLFYELAREKIARRIKREVSAEPMREATTWNFHYVFVNSADGAAPWRPGFPARDTAFRTKVEADGTMVSDDAGADAVAAELAPDVDLVVILVRLLPGNESITIKERDRLRHLKKKWRTVPPTPDADVASPGDVRPNADIPSDGGRVRISTVDTEAFIHEVGHATYGLGDEYDEVDATIPEREKYDIALTPNLTCDSTGARWRGVLSTAPVEGGGTYKKGVWRPEKHCRMLESRSRNFCTVCAHFIRGHHGKRAPSAPLVLTPSNGATIRAPKATATLHKVELPITWSAGSGGPAYSFHLVLKRVETGRTSWSNDIEGHLRGATVSLRVKNAGEYRIGVRADGPGGRSETVWRDLKVVFVEGSSGVVGAVDDGD